MRNLLLILLTILSGPLAAQRVESVYTSLDMDADCRWETDEYESAVGVCSGYADYPIYIAEGDLRMSVQFGEVSETHLFHDGFMQFNFVNNVVEWRVEDDRPYATILRWYITNLDEDGMNIDGETLVVSTIADINAPEAERTSCHVAYVDALANPEPNQLARQVAHLAARTFRCGVDVPIYVGIKGDLAGAASRWHPAESE